MADEVNGIRKYLENIVTDLVDVHMLYIICIYIAYILS